MPRLAECRRSQNIGSAARLVSETYKAAERALTAANCTSNVELITRALFEYARSGCEVGDEERVKDAEKRVRELLVLQKAQELPSVHYVLAYCHYFSCDVLQAAKCLERTISLLSSQQGAIDLFQAYLGYGVCLHYSCEPRRAVDAYMTAISLARRMGDDARASDVARSEEHTSELQSQSNLVCRLLLEKKKKKKYIT